jgi:fatty-acyl-CoA synthase
MDGEGYLRTGDLGIVDDEGYVHLVGRSTDVVIRGGFNVHPREVEDRLTSHPAVERAAVVGYPDEILGEALCAFVVRVEGGVVTQSELRDWSAAALSEYKLPDRVRFVDELPMTGSGKIWRLELARLARTDQASELIQAPLSNRDS